MTRKRKFAARLVNIAAIVLAGAVFSADVTAGPAESKVFLNGKPVAVHFNDGDSFRVLRGRQKGAKARLAGFNTLESHGPVHQWGDWTTKEMYVLAKMATLHARRGVWHCTTDGKADTYGRMLTYCPGLAEELIRLGYAHALTVTDDPSDDKLLAAQREAQEARRGIWAHGIPEYIVTSIHSVEEDINGRGTYNRTVDTRDGHSVMWRHTTRYSECQKVCKMRFAIDDAKVAEVLSAFKADADAAKLIEGLSDDALSKAVRDFAMFRHVDREIPKERRWQLIQLFQGYLKAGWFGEQAAGEEVSCMVHVDFKRRYGTGKASCLK